MPERFVAYVPWCEKALYNYSSFPFLSRSIRQFTSLGLAAAAAAAAWDASTDLTVLTPIASPRSY